MQHSSQAKQVQRCRGTCTSCVERQKQDLCTPGISPRDCSHVAMAACALSISACREVDSGRAASPACPAEPCAPALLLCPLQCGVHCQFPESSLESSQHCRAPDTDIPALSPVQHGKCHAFHMRQSEALQAASLPYLFTAGSFKACKPLRGLNWTSCDLRSAIGAGKDLVCLLCMHTARQADLL